jgi:hypothetical protein
MLRLVGLILSVIKSPIQMDTVRAGETLNRHICYTEVMIDIGSFRKLLFLLFILSFSMKSCSFQAFLHLDKGVNGELLNG